MATFTRLTQVGKLGAALFILPTPVVGAVAAFPDILGPEKPFSAAYERAYESVTGVSAAQRAMQREAAISRNLMLLATAGATLTMIGAIMVLVGREQYSVTAEWETVGKPPPPGSWNEKGQP